MLLQQREIKVIQERTAALRRKIQYAEDAPTDADMASDTEASEAYKLHSGYGRFWVFILFIFNWKKINDKPKEE